jgi:drug/metabolite transporter (DMT)-like permease
MIYLIPIIGALALASATIMEKVALRKRKIDAKLFQTAAFLASIIVMLPLIYFFWKVTPEATQTKNILIFLGVIIVSFFANVCLFFAIKWEKISNIEPALIMEPLFTVLLAFILSFFTQGLFERDPQIIIPALIAASALIFSHVKKHHIVMNKYFLAAVLGSFFFGSELVISRLILDFYNPITFYFLRCSSVFLVSLILFRPKFSKLDSKVKWEILLIGALWVLFRVLLYYGYLSLGVIFTTLVVMLAPVFVYLFARIFLKEKLDKRNIIASIIIIACVLYVVLL